MQRFKSSGAGTKKTLLSMLAAQVESQAWYATRMTEYLDKAPALLEKGPVVMKHAECLASMTINFESVPALLTICKQILPLKAVLRAGSCDALIDALQKAISSVQALCKEHGRTVGKERVEQLSQLFAEASNLYPLDASLHETATHIGELMQLCGQREIVFDLKAQFEKLLEVPVDNPAMIQEGLQDLDPKIQGVTVDQSLLQDECGEVMNSIYKFLLQILDAYCTAGEGVTSIVVSAAEALLVLAGWRAIPQDVKLAKKLRADVAVAEALSELATCSEDDEGLIQKAQALQRRLGSSKTLGDLSAWNVQLQCFKPLVAGLSQAEAALAKTCGRSIERNKQKVINLKQELSDHAGGLVGGQDWLADYQGNDWASLLEHASLTLLTQDAPHVLDVHKKLQQACV